MKANVNATNFLYIDLLYFFIEDYHKLTDITGGHIFKIFKKNKNKNTDNIISMLDNINIEKFSIEELRTLYTTLVNYLKNVIKKKPEINNASRFLSETLLTFLKQQYCSR